MQFRSNSYLGLGYFSISNLKKKEIVKIPIRNLMVGVNRTKLNSVVVNEIYKCDNVELGNDTKDLNDETLKKGNTYSLFC